MNGFNFNNHAPQNRQSGDTRYIDSGSFWPLLDLDDLRQARGIDTTVTPERLFDAAVAAAAYVNDQLTGGFGSRAHLFQHLNQTDDRRVNGVPLPEIRYRRAVYSYTEALLLEAYGSYDATGKTASRSEAKQKEAEDCRREGHHAVADLLERPRIDSELI